MRTTFSPAPLRYLWLRELICRMFDHSWVELRVAEFGRTVVGKTCTRCGDTTGRPYHGQYPVPR